MISHEHRYIFIHQRKCAGMAVAKALGIGNDSPNFHVFNEGTQSDDERYGHWHAHPEWTGSYHIFAVCRNPWDRFVSGWRYLPATRDLDLRALLDSIDAGKFDDDEGVVTHLIRPQLTTLLDREGRFVPSTMLRFERLESDFLALCERLGIPHGRFPVENASKRKPYWTYFDNATRERVARLFQSDIEHFDYDFEPPDQITRRLYVHFRHLRNRVVTRVRYSRLGRFLPGEEG